MKRLVITVLVMVLFTSETLATDQYLFDGGSADSIVSYHVDSTFCVMIPQTIQANGVPVYFTASSLDLCEGDRVVISVTGTSDGKISLQTIGGKTMQAEVYSTKTKANVVEGADIAVFDMQNRYSADGITIKPLQDQGAGDYYGTLTFNIKCVDATYQY